MKIIQEATETKEGRIALSSASYQAFMFIYLPHHMLLEPAEFHGELTTELQSGAQFLSVIGFRGCAKTTMASLGFILWAAVTKQYHFILNVGDTATQAAINIENIRYELENNEQLMADFGDMSVGISKLRSWTQTNLLLNNGVRIMSRSRGQKVRGLKHRETRPDLVVIDDPEEREKVQRKEYRDKTQAWLEGDVIPAIEEFKSRLIIIGNKLHMDGLMMRISNGKIAPGLFKTMEFPLIDANGKCLWPGKFPDQEALDRQMTKVGRIAWLREYLLKVIPPDGQDVKDEWIQRYDKIPESPIKAAVGVDLAISKKSTADYTSMVSGVVAYHEGRPKIYIQPNPVNERLSALETQNRMKLLAQTLRIYMTPVFYVEDVAYQRAAVELAEAQLLAVQGIRAGGDKRARLATVATFIQNGTVVFPQSGCEDLIAQLVGFGVEDHDDLVDAFVYLILGLSQEGFELQKVILL